MAQVASLLKANAEEQNALLEERLAGMALPSKGHPTCFVPVDPPETFHVPLPTEWSKCRETMDFYNKKLQVFKSATKMTDILIREDDGHYFDLVDFLQNVTNVANGAKMPAEDVKHMLTLCSKGGLQKTLQAYLQTNKDAEPKAIYEHLASVYGPLKSQHEYKAKLHNYKRPVGGSLRKVYDDLTRLATLGTCKSKGDRETEKLDLVLSALPCHLPPEVKHELLGYLESISGQSTCRKKALLDSWLATNSERVHDNWEALGVAVSIPGPKRVTQQQPKIAPYRPNNRQGGQPRTVYATEIQEAPPRFPPPQNFSWPPPQPGAIPNFNQRDSVYMGEGFRNRDSTRGEFPQRGQSQPRGGWRPRGRGKPTGGRQYASSPGQNASFPVCALCNRRGHATNTCRTYPQQAPLASQCTRCNTGGRHDPKSCKHYQMAEAGRSEATPGQAKEVSAGNPTAEASAELN